MNSYRSHLTMILTVDLENQGVGGKHTLDLEFALDVLQLFVGMRSASNRQKLIDMHVAFAVFEISFGVSDQVIFCIFGIHNMFCHHWDE